MSEERVRELIDAAADLPPCAAQVEILEEAVREADNCQWNDGAFYARKELMRAAELSGNGDRVLVAFSWCLAKADEEPEEYNEFDLLWEYKWAIFNCVQFAQVDRSQIENMLDDFAVRLQRNGYSRRPATYLHMQYECLTGRLESAESKLQQWMQEPRDQFADCIACECDNRVELRFFQQRDDEALEIAAPLLSGQQSCAEVPHRTLATMTLSSLRIGKQDDAKEYHRRGYRMTRNNLDFLRQVGLHALYVARQRDPSKGAALLEQHLPLAMTARIPRDRLEFFNGAAAVARMLGNRDLAIRLPSTQSPHPSGGPVLANELADWLQHQADELCQQFDRRNGSEWQSDVTRYFRELAEG